MSEDHVDDEEPATEVAEHMVDAVSYLSAVAKKAGLESISSDLLAIGRKLRAKAEPAVSVPARAPARRVKRSV
jgi:hypothetical protein